MKLSIVVPCHNEEDNIPLIMEEFEKLHTAHKNVPFELILVDNASTDNSTKVFKELLAEKKHHFVKVVDEPTPGYGRAIVTGLKSAHGELLAWTHADLQTDPADIIRALNIYKTHKEKIIIKGKRVNRTFGAWAFTMGMSVIASTLLLGKYSDINAQPKLFSREFFKDYMKNPPKDFSLDLYLLATAKSSGYEVVTFPVEFKKRIHGESKWAFSFSSQWKTISRTVRYIWKLAWS